MSKTQQIIDAIKPGKRYTGVELENITGQSRKNVQSILCRVAKNGLVEIDRSQRPFIYFKPGTINTPKPTASDAIRDTIQQLQAHGVHLKRRGIEP